jgi:hypothetical protein
MLPGNPVFSVYQTDVIHYGSDLENYLQNEFSYHLRGPGEYWQMEGQPREIDFWSMLVALNDGEGEPAAS